MTKRNKTYEHLAKSYWCKSTADYQYLFEIAEAVDQIAENKKRLKELKNKFEIGNRAVKDAQKFYDVL